MLRSASVTETSASAAGSSAVTAAFPNPPVSWTYTAGRSVSRRDRAPVQEKPLDCCSFDVGWTLLSNTTRPRTGPHATAMAAPSVRPCSRTPASSRQRVPPNTYKSIFGYLLM